jgi:hypothetical protein
MAMKTCLLFFAAWFLSLAPVWAGTITVVSGKVGGKEFGPKAVSGPGGSYAHVEAGADMDPPGGQGIKANDQTKIAGTQTQTIDENVTKQIGGALKNTVGVKLQGKSDLDVGRSIFYKADESADKVKEAQDGNGSAMLFKRAALGNQPIASVNQTITLTDKQFIGEGTVNANAPGRGQFAVGILADPIVFHLDSTTLDPSVPFVLESDLSLQATEPGDLAEAVFEISQDTTTVLDFALLVTSDTTSRDQVIVPLAGDTTLLGMSAADYLNQNVLPFLNWNSTTHTLTATTDITLYQFTTPSDGTPVTATFNFAGISSTTPIPEPSTRLIFGGLGILAIATIWGRRRAFNGPCQKQLRG